MRNVSARNHAHNRQISRILPWYGEGWLAYIPLAGGGWPVSSNARQISAPAKYSPMDHTDSESVISSDNIRGGFIKSLTRALSPTVTCHGNSPITYVAVAIALWK